MGHTKMTGYIYFGYTLFHYALLAHPTPINSCGIHMREQMDLSVYESEQKQREQLAAKVRELQEKNTELQKAATNYYLYTAEGERLFCERHNCRIYPDNRGIYWHFKVADYPAYTLPTEISRAYLNHEISIRDVYVHWRKNER